MNKNTDPADTNGSSEIEPDYRFTLANERTFLSWIRTALGLVAGGVAVHQLVPDLAAEGARTALAALCLFLAAVLAVTSYPRWYRVQQAMRRGQPLPRNILITMITGGVLVITLFATVLVIVA